MFNQTSLTSPMTENRVPSSQIRQERARSQNYTSRGILRVERRRSRSERGGGHWDVEGGMVGREGSWDGKGVCSRPVRVRGED